MTAINQLKHMRSVVQVVFHDFGCSTTGETGVEPSSSEDWLADPKKRLLSSRTVAIVTNTGVGFIVRIDRVSSYAAHKSCCLSDGSPLPTESRRTSYPVRLSFGTAT